MTKVFTAGEVLTAADVNTYLVNTTGSPNAIINGAFEINQRNFTSTTSANTFGFDRWDLFTAGDGTATYSSQTLAIGSIPGYEATNHARIVTSGQTSTAVQSSLRHKVEDVRTFAGNVVTLSFYAKAATGTPKIAINARQNFGSGGSSSQDNFMGQATISTSWARYSISFTVPSMSGKTIGTGSFTAYNLIVSAGSDNNSISGSLGIQSNTFDIWGVQLEAGPVATPFRRNANSLQGELAACQRYYFRTSSGAFSPYGNAFGVTTTTAVTNVNLPVTMRAAPLAVEFSTLGLGDGLSLIAATNVALSERNLQYVSLVVTAASGVVVGKNYLLQQNNNVNGFLALSAEL
jgi:hypothetical protein